jgi:hypothetical protein
MADVKTKQFFGTAQTLMAITTDTAAGDFTAAGTAFDNTSDAAVPYATHAVATLDFAMAVDTTTLYPQIELWGVRQNVVGAADDTDAPNGTARKGAFCLGSWTVSSGTSPQKRSIVIDLAGITNFLPYIRNGSAQALNNDATTLALNITPFCYGVTV